ncbi:MAG: hypothetical protein AAFV80_13555, partial [Bacteroidota bacterium]
ASGGPDATFHGSLVVRPFLRRSAAMRHHSTSLVRCSASERLEGFALVVGLKDARSELLILSLKAQLINCTHKI